MRAIGGGGRSWVVLDVRESSRIELASDLVLSPYASRLVEQNYRQMGNKGTYLNDGAEKGFVSRKLILLFVRSFLLLLDT